MSETEKKSKPVPIAYVLLDTPAEVFATPKARGRPVDSGTVKYVLLELVSHVNARRNGTEVWPSIARLASLAGRGESTVRRALQVLEALELIKTRTDNGKSNAYTINVEVIRSLCDPRHGDRGQAADPCHGEGGTPVMVTGDPCHGDTRTAKEQPIRTAEGFSPFGCSKSSRLVDGDHQRKMALAGVVAGAAGRMRVNHAEQPKEEKPEERKTGTGRRL